MKVAPITVTALQITHLLYLDPVRVILQDTAPSQGRITIECCGVAWSHWWRAMGGLTIGEFIVAADDDYLVGRLCVRIDAGAAPATKAEKVHLRMIVQAVQKALREINKPSA